MTIGLIGLGKMGYNLALNMRDQGFKVHAFNRKKEKLKAIKEQGIEGYTSVEELVQSLEKPRVVWLMITAGDPVEQMVHQLSGLLEAGDIIVDGGNSRFKDTMQRGDFLEKQSIYYIDAGTSGGTKGARYGACLMVGGDNQAVAHLEPVFRAICVEEGYLHTGRRGSGHYVKMIHNGIEYGMMQAIGEGFNILKSSEFDLDYERIANVWNHGSIIQGFLMQMTKQAFLHHQQLEEVEPIINALGEGQWTVEEAVKLGVPAPVITNALFVRYASKDKEAFSNKVVAALRKEFGGHGLQMKHKKD